MNLDLSLSCLPSDRTYPLYYGDVKPSGINLNVLLLKDDDAYWSWKKMRNHLFDVSEMSISNYLIQLDQGNTDLVALPVFLSRGFRHSNIFVNSSSGISQPEDLKGKKIGIGFYDPTTPVWVRGFLQHQYGVSPEDISWYLYDISLKGTSIDLPKNLDIDYLSREHSLDKLLIEGELDAIVNAGQPPLSYQNGDPRISPLFSNFHEEELKFYKKFHVFPIIHTVVVKREILKQYPWVAQSLYDSFCKAKQACSLTDMALDGHFKYSLPFLTAYVEETKQVFNSDDPWLYGVPNNKLEIETLIRYCQEQGLIQSELSLEQTFITDLNEKHN